MWITLTIMKGTDCSRSTNAYYLYRLSQAVVHRRLGAMVCYSSLSVNRWAGLRSHLACSQELSEAIAKHADREDNVTFVMHFQVRRS
jgi:predicted RNase H-related nuclease YkuK (DUF458 family)